MAGHRGDRDCSSVAVLRVLCQPAAQPPGEPARPACCCLPAGAQSAEDIIVFKHASES